MKIKKKLPPNTQFAFKNLNNPDTIRIQCDLNVFLGDGHFDNEPVLYRVVIYFDKAQTDTTELSAEYMFSYLELFDQQNIEPFDHTILEKKLQNRLEDLFADCSFTNSEPLKPQLHNLLSEFGDNSLSRFYL